ncbi:MAG: hypothetical protein IJU52_06435 [Clostridia bacterium]|nr:hypothetical protein [Clostridia bacterium]
MQRKTRIIHYSVSALSWAAFILSSVRLAAVYPSLPRRIGIHFGPDGAFDIFDDKGWAFYPYAVALGGLLLFELLSFLAVRARAGKNTAPGGRTDVLSKETVLFLLDVFKPVFALFFAGEWADCVLRQRPMNTALGRAGLCVAFGSLFAAAAVLITLKIASARKKAAGKEKS